MIRIILRDGSVRDIDGCDSAEVEPVKTYPEMLVIKEHSYSSDNVASFVLSEVLGYEHIKSTEEK